MPYDPGVRGSGATLLLRFFCELANARTIADDDVLGLLERLVALRAQPELGDLGCFLALRALPWVGARMTGEHTARIDALVASVEEYVAATRPTAWAWAVTVVGRPRDALAALVEVLPALRQGACPDLVVLASSLFESEFAKSEPHALPALAVRGELPLELSSLKAWRPPVCLTLPAPTDAVMAPAERWLLEEVFIMTVECFSSNMQECATQLLSIPYLHPLFDRVLVETLVGQSLRLPGPAFPPIFYLRLLAVIRTLQNSVKEPYVQVLTHVIQHVGELETESVDALSELFALHLVFNNYEWDWDWLDDVDQEMKPAENGDERGRARSRSRSRERTAGSVMATSRRRFLERSFTRLMRLSFFDNLSHRLPARLHRYFPREPVPQDKFDAAPLAQFTELVQLVRIKDPQEDAVTDFLMKLLRNGAKTPTHQARLFDGYGRIFETLRPSDAAAARTQQLAILRAVFEVFERMVHRLELTVDLMLTRGILDGECVVDFVLQQSPEVVDAPHNWAVLHLVIRKSLERAETVRADLEAAKRTGRDDAAARVADALESVTAETERMFLRIFGALAALHGACADAALQKTLVDRYLAMGRKYHHFVQPFVEKIEASAPPAFERSARVLRLLC